MQQIIYVHDSRIVCDITKESIAQMLHILYHVVYETLDDDDLDSKYQALSQFEREKMLCNLLSLDAPLSTGPSPFKSTIYPKLNRQAITMICQVLGYEHDRGVDETILGLLYVLCPPESITLTKFDYCKFLQEVINFQLSNFHNTKSFRYQAYLVHLIFFSNSSYFERFIIKKIYD